LAALAVAALCVLGCGMVAEAYGASNLTLLAIFAAGLTGLMILTAVQMKQARAAAAERELRAQAQASLDPATGFANRARFLDALADELVRGVRYKSPFAVLKIDIDALESIQAVGGDRASEAALGMVAQHLRSIVRASDVVARVGPGRLALIQRQVSRPEQVMALVERIRQACCRDVLVGGQEVTIGVAIGIVMVPDDASTVDLVMRRAEMALQRARAERQRGHAFYDAALEDAAQLRRHVELGLRAALQGDGLDVVFQPKVSPDGRQVLGVEALMRWPAHLGDPVAPDVFVAIAEDLGLIGPLSMQFWRKAVRELARWPELPLALNLSPVQFGDEGMVAQVQALLAETGMAPQRLELELTERVLVSDRARAVETIARIRALGVRIALDDFGTGYSGLTYLKDFSLDTIKIDRSFVRDISAETGTAAIVQGVILIARSLGLSVVAEGVETAQEQRFLQGAGVHALQGYLFARPLPVAQLEVFLSAHDFAQTAGAGDVLPVRAVAQHRA
jgi:diguanylate cyclase (GGDEF)-like protein